MDRENVVEIRNLKMYFDIKMGLSGLWSKEQLQVKAVDDISMDIRRGEVISLVGETGCGKTTVGRLILRLDTPTAGHINFEGADIAALKTKQVKQFRKKAQMIFQDPYASLNPRMTVSQTVSEPLINYGYRRQPEIMNEKVAKALRDAGLRPIDEYIERFPHELSGGERQRVSIARALVMEPTFIVADEPVSMLDVSIRAGVMNLMMGLRDKYGIAYQLITHDISVARYMSDRIAIMYLGKIMELADTETIIKRPFHPYTRALIKAVPIADPTRERPDLPIKGDIPSPIHRPSGCVFNTRCIYAVDECRETEPPLKPFGKNHEIACILAHRGDLPEPEPLEEDEACEGYEKTTDSVSSSSDAGPREGGAP
ncbi:MAG: ATP-binding cassette domain-containing protein [Thermoplasmata archaeon]|nr:ATP-binding cassette domain-containing protein [Thermoplasmata archaeon]